MAGKVGTLQDDAVGGQRVDLVLQGGNGRFVGDRSDQGIGVPVKNRTGGSQLGLGGGPFALQLGQVVAKLIGSGCKL